MIRAVLFDWDGTLVDTAEASFRCYVKMFADLGVPFDRATYERTYSPNWYQTFRMIGLPENLWPEADRRWLEYFASEKIRPIDGAHEAIDRLARLGIARGIVTSGSRDRVRRELVAHGLAGRFDHVVFGDDTTNRKPHPEALELCLHRMRIRPREAAYVGDSPEDVLMARAAGVLAVAIPGSYPNRRALQEAEPDVTAESLEEAVRVLTGNP
ncbi:MAG TPA: HAD family hydrolase [Thermoanaerobaculia bacterium]|nr:HAD family hydrolase [Thermoanaerobaculia bacterium]